jgi:DNA-binding NtrC family response regulator
MVVDPDEHIRRLLQFNLKRSGCETLLAEDGEHALRALDQRKSVDLVVLHLRLPGLSGLETLHRIHRRADPPSVIVMAVEATMEEVVKCLKQGAYDFVRKTNGFDDLRLSIRNALQAIALKREVANLRARLEESDAHFPEIVSRSPAMAQVKRLVRMVSNRDITVLIEGESGSGKELIARAIHSFGQYRDKPFVAINCAAIPDNLLESELFGHERGAFTGAVGRRVGKFEEANGGTLFLDEVGELNPALQAKLLRVLQTKEIQPVGGQARKVNVRIISATNQDLGETARRGLFRQDLYYRLAVFPIQLPPLRDRKEDILELARFFQHRFAAEEGHPVEEIGPEVEQALLDYDWPGNVRELENMIYRAVVLAESGRLELKDFPVLRLSASARVAPPGAANSPAAASQQNAPDRSRPALTLEQIEALAIRRTLESTAGNISRAAALLHVSRATLYRKIRKLGIPLR